MIARHLADTPNMAEVQRMLLMEATVSAWKGFLFVVLALPYGLAFLYWLDGRSYSYRRKELMNLDIPTQPSTPQAHAEFAYSLGRLFAAIHYPTNAPAPEEYGLPADVSYLMNEQHESFVYQDRSKRPRK